MPTLLRLKLVLVLVSAAALPGCNILGFGGAMIESYRRSSTRAVEAEYDGLRGKSFAVIVTGDRVLQGTYPTLFPRMTSRLTERLIEQREIMGITGFVPPLAVMEFQLSNPNWTAWNNDRVAEELGVDRLIVVEMYEYRLNEIGNAYLWDGLAAARVGVVELDGSTPTEFTFQKDIQVGFPNERGMGPEDLPQDQVQGNLDKRFVDRVTWLFYEHQEPYYPEY